MVKVIILEYGFLESQNRVSRINLEASRSISNLVGVCVGEGEGLGCGVVVEGVCGVRRWGGEWGHDYWECYDPLFEFSIRDSRFRDPRI